MPDAQHDRARYRRILRFAAWHLIVTWWYEFLLPRIGLGRIADRTRTARMHTVARRFRALAVELGGLMIKLGQFLSTRLDVLPPEITKELEDLQDEVPAAPFDQIRALAEADLGVPLDQVYASVDEEPVASASLGQVYRARLATADRGIVGYERVVVKVQRPGIADIIAVDLAALRRVGWWLSRFRAISQRVDMPALVEEFARTSREEVDYLHEAQNAERFAANFAGDARVRVPQIVWERTTRRVLTLEDVSAIKITDIDGLKAARIDPKAVAAVFASVMFDQFFEHGYFHADPHPGNLFVEPTPSGDGFALTFVDFGMMGEIPVRLRNALRSLIIASASRNGRGMVDAMQEAGVLLPGADTVELERAMTEVFARFGGMGFAELREIDPREFRRFALEFGDLMVTMPFQMPESFLLLMRAVSLTSGMGSSLDPGFNAWDTVEPYARKLLREESLHVVGDVRRQAIEAAGIAWRMPKRIDSVLGKLEDGTVAVSVPHLENALDRAEKTVKRLVSALIFCAMLVAGARLHADAPGWGAVLMLGSLVPLAHVVFGRRRPR
ncbi:ABC1 kinase family protein [Demequina mangrovi]|uniref:Predicted unusual protein kinase regulating ubiquinone biosynthesis, AarF/ABC1/UbiB family n=1 Tax=Demequina mangrovi TaxID=1043493 RepID=A0A1H7B1Q9_9MICO|nr:AarF/UbiB family protein [Demequina mangrovi]SEJ71719.1 Predicted unusual protein kinase regulating ubiquinone biosynthesis, AarF/ABC1/UbiB family [Demequina mangrovi]